MKSFSLSIRNSEDLQLIEKIGVALSSPIRVNILHQVNSEGKTISELVKLNHVSFSSIIFHLKLLKEVDLVRISTIKINNVTTKYVIKGCQLINLSLIDPIYDNNKKRYTFVQELKVGSFSQANFGDNNGYFVDKHFLTFYENTPYRQERFNASLIYTNFGYVEYTFDNSVIKGKHLDEISVSLEICSEMPYYNNTFESLIGFEINDVEVASFISPGDFGGRRGKMNTDDIPFNATQYGQLKTIAINNIGTYFDGVLINENIKIKDLNLESSNGIRFKVVSKLYNNSYGGFNIFGKNYGDYPQDIKMTLICENE